MGSIARSLPRPRLGSLPSGPVLRRRLAIVVVLAAVLAAAYWFWFRDSSFVAVEAVRVSGTEEQPELASKLEAAALEQTTLNVDEQALLAAVSDDPAVRGVSAAADFPHKLTIEVDLRDPVGYLPSTGEVVAGDGVILERVGEPPGELATIEVEDGKLGSGDMLEGNALTIAKALGPAPVPLLEKVTGARMDAEHGVVVTLKGGIELRFGDRADHDLKWKAAAAVLADPKLTTASYIDLSVPDRPVVGGVPAEPETDPAVDPQVLPEG